jgi:subtilase family serine protease
MDFMPKTEDKAPSGRNRVGFGLDKCPTANELLYFRLRPVVKKGFLMLRSMSPGAFLLMLLIAITNASLAHAQAATQVHPLFVTQVTGQNGVVGFTPDQIRRGYGFDQIPSKGRGQTIAIVDAFDHPDIENDLKVFNKAFNLPACTTQNGCFKKIYASGSNPGTDPFWAFEIALDVEWAHAIAPEAKILLVEAAGQTLDDLLAAVDVAVAYKPQPTTVSMSWGGSEFATEVTEDSHFIVKNRKVTFFAAAGDSGRGVMYPAASPYVMGVGGTSLRLDKDGNYLTETPWSRSGGGLSSVEPEPLYQSTFPIPNNPQHMRGTPDIAYVGDPTTGVAIYDSIPFQNSTGWSEVGGTSVGPPQWAALFAIANSMRAGGSPLIGSGGILYDAAKRQPSDFHDVTQGRAQPGYDYVTGLGSPQANNLIPTLQSLP